jgi:predicted DNA-binding transcriptional regulator AlpA
MAQDERSEFVGLSEVCEILGGIRSNLATYYTNRPEFPEPVARLNGGRLWRRADVEAWFEAWSETEHGRKALEARAAVAP